MTSSCRPTQPVCVESPGRGRWSPSVEPGITAPGRASRPPLRRSSMPWLAEDPSVADDEPDHGPPGRRLCRRSEPVGAAHRPVATSARGTTQRMRRGGTSRLQNSKMTPWSRDCRNRDPNVSMTSLTPRINPEHAGAKGARDWRPNLTTCGRSTTTRLVDDAMYDRAGGVAHWRVRSVRRTTRRWLLLLPLRYVAAGGGGDAKRPASYAVQSAEGVTQFALISTIMPHTSRRSADNYRWAMIISAVLILGRPRSACCPSPSPRRRSWCRWPTSSTSTT